MKKIKINLIPGWATTSRLWNRVIKQLHIPVEIKHTDWQEVLTLSNGTTMFLQPGEPTIIMGWSMGALLALHAATLFPESISGLVLISGTSRLTADSGYSGVKPSHARAMNLMLRKNHSAYLRTFFEAVLSPEKDSNKVETLLKDAISITAGDLHNGLDYLIHTDLRDKLPGITIPVLLLHGTKDNIIPFESGRYLADNLPRAKFVKFTGHGHALPLTVPEEISSWTGQFINDIT